MKLTPLHNHFIFKFVDRTNSKGEFEREATESGIVLQSNFEDSAKQPRWVDVVAVGPACKDIAVGDRVLLPNLRWTIHFKNDDEKMWRSDESEAVAVRKNGGAVQPLRNVVLFEPKKHETVRSSGIILVVGSSDDTPSGQVVAVGPDAYGVAVGDTLYYNDVNFTDKFVSADGKSLAFIKDENILALA